MKIVIVDEHQKKRRIRWEYIVVPIIVILLILTIYGFSRGCPECDTTADCPFCPPCDECICEENEKECPTITLDCSKCPAKNLVYYFCPNGSMVTRPLDCKHKFSNITVDSPYQNTKWNVTLGIDDIDWEIKEKDFGHITKIEFTILNKQNNPILPKINVNIYNTNSSLGAKGFTHKEFVYNETLEAGAWIKKTEYTSISFNGKNQTVKLVLVNSIPDPNKMLVMAAMQINE